MKIFMRILLLLLLTKAGIAQQKTVVSVNDFEKAVQAENTQLVDVRSRAELELVGRVPNTTAIEWAFYPGMVANPDFAAQLNAQVNKEALVIFMCRTGGRSHNAAVVAQQLGFKQVFNMIEGFEGDANAQKQRTLINGWKHAGLPWTN